jgi:hypothetical protein
VHAPDDFISAAPIADTSGNRSGRAIAPVNLNDPDTRLGRCIAGQCLAIRLYSGCQAGDFLTRRTDEGDGGSRRRVRRHLAKCGTLSLNRGAWNSASGRLEGRSGAEARRKRIPVTGRGKAGFVPYPNTGAFQLAAQGDTATSLKTMEMPADSHEFRRAHSPVARHFQRHGSLNDTDHRWT